MLVYRVFPHRKDAAHGRPFSAEYAAPGGGGRWDNPRLYSCVYLASSPEGAIGETFAGWPRWSEALLLSSNDSVRRLATFRYEEERFPTVDFDDAATLAARSLRPSRIVQRNRPATQELAARIWDENKWAGISWWSTNYPLWQVHALWDPTHLECVGIDDIRGHPAFEEAARTLVRQFDK